MGDESIRDLKTTEDNLRLHFVNFGPNAHQHYMMFFRHFFRHLVQIKEIKANPRFSR